MNNVIIVAILLVIVCAAIMPSVKHFKGQSGCCGSDSYKPKKKRLNHAIAKKTFQIEGMRCENCKNKVMEAVNDIEGVSAVVDIKKGAVEVSYAKHVEDTIIIEKIKRAGYTVVR